MSKRASRRVIVAGLICLGLLARKSEGQEGRVRSVTIFSNFDINSTSFVFTGAGGAGAEDGWVAVAMEPERAIQVDIEALTATSVEFVIQGRLRGETTAAKIWPATGDRSETATGSFIVQVPDAIYQLRVGIKVTGDTAGAEDIDVVLNTFAPDRR